MHFSASLARRDDDGTSMFIGGGYFIEVSKKSRVAEKCAIAPVAFAPNWCNSKLTESFDESLTYVTFEAVNCRF
jgi:hypothetical protein